MEEEAITWASYAIIEARDKLQDSAIYDDLRRYLEQVSQDLDTHIKHLSEVNNV